MDGTEETVGPDTLVVFDKNSRTIQKFKTATDEWHTGSNGLTENMGSWSFTATALNKALLIFMSNKSVYRFQHTPKGPIWHKLPDMKVNHGQYPPVAVLKGSFFIAGTCGQGFPSNKCERYSVSRRGWLVLSNMVKARRNHALVSTDDALYSIGGLGSPGTSCSVEKYDIKTKTWSEVTTMKEPRHSAAAVASGDDIFVLGGIVCGCRRSDLFCLSMPQGTCTSLHRMNISRTLFSAHIIDGKIFAVGGDNSRHDTVEVYDASKDKWEFMDILSTLEIEAAVAMST